MCELVVGDENPNGNVGRPYLKCLPCDKFITFTDNRGITENGPRCDCNKPCRLQVAGYLKTPPRGLHWVCSAGTCRFYALKMAGDGNTQETATEQMIEDFAKQRIG